MIQFQTPQSSSSDGIRNDDDEYEIVLLSLFVTLK